MTLIVGIKCMNGIVLGADGAASLGSLGQMTAMQPVKKLSKVTDKILLGVSGAVGLSQRIEGEIKKHSNLHGREKADVMSELRKSIWTEILELEFKAAAMAAQVVGPAARNSCMCAAVVALPVKNNELALIQFDQNGSPEYATEDIPFVAIGSGQMLADPFLAFVRRMFWPNRLPSIAEGEFAVQWTLHHAIKTATGGIADPKQICVLEKNGNNIAGRELSKDECKEHEEAVGRAEDYLKKFELAPGADGGDLPAAEPIPVPQGG